MIKMDKSVIRKEIINKRKLLPLDTRLHASDSILNKLYSLEEYKLADRILIYADSNGEVPTDKLILNSLLNGKHVYAPVCGEEYSMDFYEIFALEEMYPGSYGIREPLTIDNLRLKEADINDKTLIIVPGVAFDKHNNRMGYGKGYYDRFLSRMPIINRIALSYDFQIVDCLEVTVTDIPMTKIITN